MNEAAVLEQRRQARSAKQLVDAALIDLHLKAARALLSPSKSADVRKQALQQVARWESDHLCNPRYIGAWRTILTMILTAHLKSPHRSD